ncbi:hypothetical protein [Nitrosomonas communis]|uniref:hypothetical protein n=1 Tax=Nitrosomonas communis TaxID=44574 RepID=UPI0026EFFCCA|nr:hypothetical protein [Nitrosomonas communis]MCO6427121.1 hypothetical protein [Nitrosomonas communis]
MDNSSDQKPTDNQTDIEIKLRFTLFNIDALSQDGLSEISSISRLALASLETPEGYRHMDDIANALRAIWSKAEDIQGCINAQAEDVGCNYVDNAQSRRWAAERKARSELN